MRLLLLTFCFVLSLAGYPQKIGVVYYALSAGGPGQNEWTFRNDSVVEVREFSHRGVGETYQLRYRKQGQRLQIYASDSLALQAPAGNRYAGRVLLREGNALTDEANNTVLVRKEDFWPGYTMLYVFNEERMTVPNIPWSINVTNPVAKAAEKRVNKRIKALRKEDIHDLTIYKGLPAFRRYGYHYVFGVVAIGLTSDLYRHVDSLVRQELHFDSTKVPRPVSSVPDSNSAPLVGGLRDEATRFPDYPLILVNGHPVTRASLNRGSLDAVRHIEARPPSPALTAIFGQAGTWGVVLLRTTRKLERKLRQP